MLQFECYPCVWGGRVAKGGGRDGWTRVATNEIREENKTNHEKPLATCRSLNTTWRTTEKSLMSFNEETWLDLAILKGLVEKI